MSGLPTYIALVVSLAASLWCWRRIWRSEDWLFFKITVAVMAAIPFLGPFLYLFVDMPPRRPRYFNERAKPSAFLKHWNEREHVYLGWASFVFWSLAVLAYWMNDWSPGRIIGGRHGTYTEVDVLFFSLLVGAVLTFGAALRAKVMLTRQLRQLRLRVDSARAG
jgi:hypothetical protein